MKPTRGRTPAGPDASEYWQGFAIEHAVSVSVRDCAALLDASEGHEHGAYYAAPAKERAFAEEVGREPGKLKIAVCTRPWLPSKVHSDCIDAVNDAAALLEELGHTVVYDDPDVDADEFALDFFTLVCTDTAAGVAMAEKYLERSPKPWELEKTTRFLCMIGSATSGVRMARAKQELLTQGRNLQHFMRDHDYDMLLTPTLGSPPVKHRSLQPAGLDRIALEFILRGRAAKVASSQFLLQRVAREAFEFVPFTPMANVTGQPAMNVPLYWNADDLPIGVSFMGRFGDEATLYRLAGQLEQARPWRDRRPPHAY